MLAKILFIKFGNFSNINNSVYRILKKNYPEYQIETIDAWGIIKYKTPFYYLLINFFYFLKEYGFDFISAHKKWKEWKQWFFATSYISDLITKKLKELCKGKDYKFTLQTQSLFNGKLENIPHFIYTDHTTRTNMLYPDINAKQYMRSKRFIKKCEIRAYEDASTIFVFGSLVAHSLISQYKIAKEKVSIVYAGSNVNYKIPLNSEKYFLQNILFVGTEWERKGGPLLLEVFKNVLIKHPNASLTIIGCNPKNITLPNCKVLGKVAVEKIFKYYNLASIFCLPTVKEPFGIVFVEAMSFRLPILANNIGCIPDLVINDYNGYLINNDIKQYTEAITNLLDNPLKCLEMGENGYQYSQSKFTWEIVGESIKKGIDKFL